ncbi:MAG: alpha/beta hydrolase [Candidatus Limnocylindria bacterium]
MTRQIAVRSERETLSATLYGELPQRRAAILVHGQNWNADGWAGEAPSFPARGIPALALDLRGHGRSTGTTDDFVPGKPWSPVADLAAAKAYLREQGVREIALIGASLGGHAVLASSWERDNECLVTISAPVVAVPDELSRRVHGRKLYVCAQHDRSGAFPHVLESFAALAEPKMLVAFGGEAHSRWMFDEPYGRGMLELILDFVAQGL